MKSSVVIRTGYDENKKPILEREEIEAHEWNNAPMPFLKFRDLQRNHKIKKYATDFMCLDTETSHSDELTGWVYQWAVKFKNVYVYGRKPSEIIEYLKDVAEHYKLTADKRIIIYVHNLQYDFQYLKHELMKYDPSISCLAIDNHTVLTVNVLGFRFICSYKLTNMSLAALSDNYSKRYVKAVGEIDYSIIRYQDSKLNATDWEYMFSDVASQYDGVSAYLEMNEYKFAADAPFTSTGFVRAVCRNEARNDPKWRDEFESAALNLQQYRLCKQTFMGGITICSWLHSGELIRSDDLGHDDFTSSYPARQMLDYMPVGAPMWYGTIDDREEFETLINTYCCIFMLTLEDVHIKQGVTAPYIPHSKCLAPDKNDLKVNGKVVYSPRLTIAVTELDYKWIKRQYTAQNMKVSDMLCFKRGAMPAWLKGVIMKYFTNKCTMKHTNPLMYSKAKNMTNGIYGMTATAIIRTQYKIDCNDPIISKVLHDDLDEYETNQLKKYYKSYNNFMEYQHAVFTTAHARDALMHMIADVVGYENFLYCDTDSVFYIKTPENIARMEAYREECKQRAIAAGAFVGDNYLGMPTPEPKIRAFKGLHAKCYAMEEWDDKKGDYKLNVVIAGIPKKSIKWIDGKPVTMTNAEELGNIDNLEDGFVFKHCGGTRCVYNERPIETIDVNGHKIELSSSAVIENIDKEISDTMWTCGKAGEILNLKQMVD